MHKAVTSATMSAIQRAAKCKRIIGKDRSKEDGYRYLLTLVPFLLGRDLLGCAFDFPETTSAGCGVVGCADVDCLRGSVDETCSSPTGIAGGLLTLESSSLHQVRLAQCVQAQLEILTY